MALGGGGREVFRQREWVGAMENKRAPGGRGGEEKPDEGRGNRPSRLSSIPEKRRRPGSIHREAAGEVV